MSEPRPAGAPHIEAELKYRVPARDDLERLARELGTPARVEAQRNRYFDTRALALHGRGVLVRLRSFAGEPGAVLTIKIADALEAGYIASREEEVGLSEAAAGRMLAGPGIALAESGLSLVAEALADVRPGDLALVGELATERRTFALPVGMLALDAVDLHGSAEFEVELETSDRGAAARYVESLFLKLGVAAWKEAEPKSGRLFRRLGPHGGR